MPGRVRPSSDQPPPLLRKNSTYSSGPPESGRAAGYPPRTRPAAPAPMYWRAKGGRGEPVVRRRPGAALDIDHARQGEAVVGPAAAVVEEELHLLLRPAGVGAGEVVSAAHEPGVAGAEVLVVEGRAAIGAPLG